MGELRREHARRPESGFRRALRAYRFEIVWLLIAVVGAVLLFDRWRIRRLLAGWLAKAQDAVVGALNAVDRSLASAIARTSPAELAGYVLVALALVALVLRLRWRVMHSAQLTGLNCPRCGGAIHRVHRRFGDRILNLLVPNRRYRCGNRDCHWQGLKVHTGSHSHTPRRR